MKRNLKKVISLTLVLMVVAVLAPLSCIDSYAYVPYPSSGAAGPTSTYTLDSDGTLTVTGTGEIFDYAYFSANSIRHTSGVSQIKKVLVGSGITSIGDEAFNDCAYLTSVSLPDTITSIGDNSFRDCKNLESIVIPSSVTSIGGYAFYNCEGLKSITFQGNACNFDNLDGDYCFSNVGKSYWDSSFTKLYLPTTWSTSDSPVASTTEGIYNWHDGLFDVEYYQPTSNSADYNSTSIDSQNSSVVAPKTFDSIAITILLLSLVLTTGIVVIQKESFK